MKKIIFLILSVCLSFIFALSGCSCVPEAYLEFENSITANIKTETLVYDVEYADTYKGIVCGQSVNKSLLPKYQNGKLTLYFNGSGQPLPTGVDKHINFDNISTFNYIRSELSIDVVVGEKTYNDKIISEVYFFNAEWAFAPVYSKTLVKNTFFAMNSSQIGTDQKIYEYTTLYKNEDYTLTKKYYSPADNEDVNAVDIENLDRAKMLSLTGDGSSLEYGLRTAIDNVQLLFIARNLNLSVDNSKAMSTITYMYTQPMKINVKNHSESSLALKTIKYNNSELTEINMPIKNMLISLNGTDHVGSTKYLSLQKDKVGEIENYALPVEYAEAIFENLAYETVGALVYKLKEVNITTK